MAPAPAICAADLAAALPLIARSKAAPLAWWRMRAAYSSSEVAVLRDAYRFWSLEAQAHAANIAAAFQALQSAKIEPMLLKGWAIARLYPEPGLRPYEDIDLVVRHDQVAAAQNICSTSTQCDFLVDFVHTEIFGFDEQDWDELYARSEVVELNGLFVRVLAPEDHLRAICIHSLKHSLSNPLWLVDIAVAVEAASSAFDWDRCFGTREPQAQWIGCAIGLARVLLGCEVPVDVRRRTGLMPRWLAPAVLDAWSGALRVAPQRADRPAIIEVLNDPTKLPHVLKVRWPSPIGITLARRVAFAQAPQWPHQLRALFAPQRLRDALRRLPLRDALRRLPPPLRPLRKTGP